MFQLAVSTFIVCFTAFELRLHHRKDNVSFRVKKLLIFNFCRRPRNNTFFAMEKKPVEDAEHDNDMSWGDLIPWVDFVLFWSMLFLTFVVTIIIIVILIYHV